VSLLPVPGQRPAAPRSQMNRRATVRARRPEAGMPGPPYRGAIRRGGCSQPAGPSGPA
jgi:hypothetical protein